MTCVENWIDGNASSIWLAAASRAWFTDNHVRADKIVTAMYRSGQSRDGCIDQCGA